MAVCWLSDNNGQQTQYTIQRGDCKCFTSVKVVTAVVVLLHMFYICCGRVRGSCSAPDLSTCALEREGAIHLLRVYVSPPTQCSNRTELRI